MLFVTGLLTLLVFSSARGDAKGGVKGSASASQLVQQITQEEATPYNFQSPASYGIKTSEPNVKTLSPSNAEIQAVAKGGSPIAQGSQQVQGKVHHASTLHHSAADDGNPASDSSATRGIKTIVVQDGSSPAAVKGLPSSPAAVKGSSSSPAAVKGSGATKSFAVAQQQEGAVLYAPKTAERMEDRIKELNRGLLRKQEEEGSLQGFGGADASFTADQLEDLSRRFGVGEEKPRTPAQVRPDVARTSPERAPASRRPAAPARSGSSGSRTQGGDVSRPTFGKDGGVRSPAVLREPVAVPVRAFQAPAPVASRGGEGIIAINRGLLQKQGEAGLAQTFGGIVGADGNLAGVSVTDAELENLSKQIGFGARAPVAARPQAPKPAVVRTSPQQVPRAQIRPGSSTPLVRVPVAAQVPRTSSPVQPTSGVPSPARPSSALGDRIIAINRELLQKQGEAGLDQTFGGIVRGADGNLAGVSVTNAELQDFSKQIGLFGSRVPAAPETSKPARPSAVRTSPQQVPATRGQYQVIPGVSRIFGTTYTQRENTRFNFGNNIGIRRPVVPAPVLREPVAVPVQTFRAPSPANLTPVPQGDSIIAINRQLIQKQGETGVAQTFGGIGGADGNLAGVSITDLELQDLSRQIGFGYRSPTVPQAPRPARPSVVRTSPQQTPGYRRPVQVIPGLSGISGITGTTFTSTGGARIARPYYPAPALRVPVPGAVPVIRAGVPTPLSPVPVVRVPSTAPVRPSQLSDDIISINRELIQKQGEAGFDPTFGGVVGTGGNLDGVSITDLELQDLTRQIGFGSRAPEAPKPVAPKPARPSVVRTSPQYIPESGRPAVSGISRVQGTRITSTQRQNTIFTKAGQVKPISPAAPSPASRKPAPVPAAGLRVPSPSPVSSPASGSPGNLIAINRQLIQKQETSGFSQAFGGITRTDGNLAGLSLTTSDLENLSKQIGFDSRPQVAPEQPKPAVSRTSPQQVPGSRPYAPGSRIPGDSQSTSQGGNIRFTLGSDDGSLGLTQPAAPVPRAPSPAAPRAPSPAAPRAPSPGSPAVRTPSPGLRTPSPGLRTPSSGFRTPSSGSPGLRTPSPGSPALRSPSGGASRTPSAVAARAPTLGSGAGVPASEAIVAINRGLIQKQGEGGLSQIFGGAIRTDADLSGLSLTASELEDLSKQIGTSGRPQAVSEPRRPGPSRPQQASGYGSGRQPARSRGPQGSTRGGEGLPQRVSQDRVIQESFEDQKLIDSPSDENDSQLQVKLVDIEDPSIQSQVSLGDFSETAYVPSFNYRVPSSRPVDGPQEQQKVEQVFV